MTFKLYFKLISYVVNISGMCGIVKLTTAYHQNGGFSIQFFYNHVSEHTYSGIAHPHLETNTLGTDTGWQSKDHIRTEDDLTVKCFSWHGQLGLQSKIWYSN